MRDPRYVSSTDPRAVLRAWGGESAQHATIMGGWTDTNEAAFRLAVHRMAREPLGYVAIRWADGRDFTEEA